MKKKYIWIPVLLFMAYSCGTGSNEGKQHEQGEKPRRADNDLLASELKVSVYISTLAEDMAMFDRFKGLYIDDLAGLLVSRALSGKLAGHNAYNMDPAVDEPLSVENINSNIGGSFVPDAYQGIMFYEQWYANAEDLVFTKRPLSYAVSRYYDSEKSNLKTLVFRYNTDQPFEGMEFEPLVKDVRHQVSFYHGFYTEFTYNLPCQVKDSLYRAYQRFSTAWEGYRFYLKLVGLIQQGQVKALDPYDHSREMDLAEFKERMGARTEIMQIPDTVVGETIEKKIELPPLYYNVSDILFEEDWEICNENLYIRKKVNYLTFLQMQESPETGKVTLVPVFSVRVNASGKQES